jgi:hypothetical protein
MSPQEATLTPEMVRKHLSHAQSSDQFARSIVGMALSEASERISASKLSTESVELHGKITVSAVPVDRLPSGALAGFWCCVTIIGPHGKSREVCVFEPIWKLD